MSSEILIYSHPECLLHDTGAGHPERADRVKCILAHLRDIDVKELHYREAPKATTQQLSSTHHPHYIRFILDQIPNSGLVNLDPDTTLSKGSDKAALRAAGAVCAAIDEVVKGPITKAFCVTRPPGHHAEPEQAMGFCLFNNVAIGAAHARHAHGIQRLAIVDFDVHHGNGTQKIFETDPNTLFVSSHEMPLFPGTGALSKTGAGNIVNIPLAPKTDSTGFRTKWQQYGLPLLRSFAPELIFISAGFDGHKDDPLASLQLTPKDYDWLTREVVAIAIASAEGRIISTLEGGYNLEALCKSCAAHVHAMTCSHESNGYSPSGEN
jgi:acetoin utilization deacetylase AcuC-like enzyme